MLNLAGLSIQRVEDDEAATQAADLVWRTWRVADVPGVAPDRPPGGVTTHLFGYEGRPSCRFDIGATGQSVESWTLPEVSGRDLLALFGEHILRSLLARRGLMSFHAASLTDGDGAILIMGDKGMGKSTLSAALQQRGWLTISDDLTRVADEGCAWRAFPGLRDTKLLSDSVTAVGLDQEALPMRWDEAGELGGGKRLLSPALTLPTEPRAFRLKALMVLRGRHAGASQAHRIAAPHDAVLHLLRHATVDALVRAPPPAVQRLIGAVVGSVPVLEVALPDRLAMIHVAAEQIEAMVRRLSVPVDG